MWVQEVTSNVSSAATRGLEGLHPGICARALPQSLHSVKVSPAATVLGAGASRAEGASCPTLLSLTITSSHSTWRGGYCCCCRRRRRLPDPLLLCAPPHAAGAAAGAAAAHVAPRALAASVPLTPELAISRLRGKSSYSALIHRNLPCGENMSLFVVFHESGMCEPSHARDSAQRPLSHGQPAAVWALRSAQKGQRRGNYRVLHE